MRNGKDDDREVIRITSLKQYKDLFDEDLITGHMQYRGLCKKWHPDVCKHPQAEKVFNHITKLYNKTPIATSESKELVLVSEGGKQINYPYNISDIFEMGKVYLSKTSIIYEYDKEWIAHHAMARMGVLRILEGIAKTPKINPMVSDLFFASIASFDTTKGTSILVLPRPKDAYRISDVLRYLGTIEHRHVAWIMSRLCNIICTLYFFNYCHNGITLDNVFIAPSMHEAYVIGGWHYATPLGAPLTHVSKEVYGILPISVKNKKKASILTDIESVKNIGRILTKGQDVPKPFVDWLWGSNAETPFEEFSKWDTALEKSYGKRKFIRLDIPENGILR